MIKGVGFNHVLFSEILRQATKAWDKKTVAEMCELKPARVSRLINLASPSLAEVSAVCNALTIEPGLFFGENTLNESLAWRQFSLFLTNKIWAQTNVVAKLEDWLAKSEFEKEEARKEIENNNKAWLENPENMRSFYEKLYSK